MILIVVASHLCTTLEINEYLLFFLVREVASGEVVDKEVFVVLFLVSKIVRSL
jgi:hypothetical protein